MRYLCLVYGEETMFDTMTVDDHKTLTRDSLAYDETIVASGNLIVAHALQSVRTARTVKRRAGRKLVTDGPFAETKEQLLGFILIEAKGLDEAVEIGSNIPLASLGKIEVRPIMDI